jgi:hypothetical protein
MRRDPDRLNRAVLILLALAAIAVSVWGVGRAAGWFDDRHPDQPLLIPSVADYVARNAHWFWPVAAALAAVICLVALGWLRAQLQLPRPASTDLVIPATDGEIRVQGDALAEALQDDVTTNIERVQRASARVTGEHQELDVDLRVEIEEDADLNDVRNRIESDVLPRFSRAACAMKITTYLDLRLQPGNRHVK